MVKYKKKQNKFKIDKRKTKLFIRKKRGKYMIKIIKKKGNKPKRNNRIKLKVILLPEDLLLKTEKIAGDKKSLFNLIKAIEIYDINDDINYNYLKIVGKITKENYQYLYTLSFSNRKKNYKEI